MDRQHGEPARREAQPAALRASQAAEYVVGVEQGTRGAARARGSAGSAGIAAIECAQENGLRALDAVERLEELPDLAAALDADVTARENWNGFSPSSRKAILWWVVSAKRPETRASRIEQTVRMAVQGLRAQLDRD